METEGDPKAQKDREVQNDQIMSPPNEMVAKEPEAVLTAAPWAPVPQEPSGHPPKSLENVCVKNVQTGPRRNPVNPLLFRQMFRKFRCEGPSRPREVFRHLLALAMQWLRPDIHTKEQMIEMLVQEQFQIVCGGGSELSSRSVCPSSDNLAESHCLFLAQPTYEMFG